MRYEKPEVVVLAFTLKAITQHLFTKPWGLSLDFYIPWFPMPHTNGAYEADE